METKTQYMRVPTGLIQSNQLSARQALILGLIDSWCNFSHLHLCDASEEEIADVFGWSVEFVQRTIKRLIQLNLVQVIQGQGWVVCYKDSQP